MSYKTYSTMNFGNFTTKAQEAFQKAHFLAQERGSEQISSLHLLLALLRQEDGLASTILRKIEVDVIKIDQGLEQEINKLPKIIGGGVGQMFLGQDLALIIEQAQKEATNFKANKIRLATKKRISKNTIIFKDLSFMASSSIV